MTIAVDLGRKATKQTKIYVKCFGYLAAVKTFKSEIGKKGKYKIKRKEKRYK